MKKNILLTLFVATMLSLNALAQNNYSVFVDFDKKVIMVDSLNLPQSFKAYGLLRMLPELLERPGMSFLENYDVQVEGMSVGDNDDVVLQELQAIEIEKLEISEDPMTTYQKNGQGGSINIVLKKKKNATMGSVAVDYSSEIDLTPQFHINYNTDKLNVRGLVLGEVYDLTSSETNSTQFSSIETKRNYNFKSELARVYMKYTPTSIDEYNFNVSESYQRINNEVYGSNKKNKTKATTFKALFNYKHTFSPRSFIKGEVQYNATPNKDEFANYFNKTNPSIITNDVGVNTIGGKVEYKTNLLPLSHKNYADLNFGVNFNYSIYDKTYYGPLNGAGSTYDERVTKGHSSFLSPFANLEVSFGKLKMKTNLEYQYFRYSVKKVQQEWATIRQRDLTGKFMLSWQFKSNKHLRFIYDRKINRPSNDQIYPYITYDPDFASYVKGNSDLRPILSNEFSIDYISNISWGDSRLTFNGSISYNLINDIVNAVLVGGNSTGGLGLTQQYISYDNIGDNKLLNIDLMVIYGYKSFSLALAANGFRNDIHADVDGDGDPDENHTHYFNISALPSITLNNGWMASLNLIYFSKVKSKGTENGDDLVGHLTIGKTFGNFNIHAFGKMSLTGRTHDIFGYLVREYDLVKNCAGIGVMYHF